MLYISGIVGAEMRKGVAYNMKIVIDGESGDVLQSHCEGPAGRGPTATCKHIVAVLLVLVQFAKDGILQVNLSCTDQLQTFKRPARAHQGSPVRAEDLGKARKGSSDRDDLGTGLSDRDPRPKKYRQWSGYDDHLYNATINFCAQSGLDLTQKYAYKKADLAAAEVHHDYLAEPLATT